MSDSRPIGARISFSVATFSDSGAIENVEPSPILSVYEVDLDKTLRELFAEQVAADAP